MTRDDIIKLAREANLPACHASHPKALERFAALVIATAQEPVGEVLNERGDVDYISYVPKPGTALYTHPPRRLHAVNQELLEALQQLCNSHKQFSGGVWDKARAACQSIATDIRARGQA